MSQRPTPYTDLPGPNTLESIKLLASFFRNPLTMYTGLSDTYGKVARAKFGDQPILAVGDATLAQTILLDPKFQFPKGRVSRRMALVLGRGLVMSEGALWQRQRKLISPFLTPRHIQGFARIMASRAHTWADQSNNLSVSNDLGKSLSTLTLEIVGDVLFGTSIGSTTAFKVQSALHRMLNHVRRETRSLYRFLPAQMREVEYQRASKEIDEVVYPLIERNLFLRERPSGDEGPVTLLQQLMTAKDERGAYLDADQIRDEVVTFIFAGHETTASTLNFALRLLGAEPEWQRWIQEEFDEAPAGLSRLPRTEAVIQETLRLFPTVPVLERETTEEVTLPTEDAPITLPGGVTLAVAPWIIHRRSEYWDEPTKFLPKRWLDQNTLKKTAYLPFGGGRRTCAGSHFAMMEAAIILRAVLSKFDVVASYPEAEVAVTLRPKNTPVSFVARRQKPVAVTPLALHG